MKVFLCKVIIIGIILLLIGTNIIPATSNYQIEKTQLFTEHQNSSLNDLIFDFKIRSLMMKAKMPSLSAAIIKNDEMVWYKGYGFSKYSIHEKPTINTVYQAGSISKTIVATAIMQLYEQGIISSLDDNVNDYLNFNINNPKYPSKNITFRMLLAHQSSIREVNNNERIRYMSLFLTKKDDYPYPLIKEILVPGNKYYRDLVWTDTPPGDNVYYTGYGAMLLEHIIETLANKSFSEYCQEKIFNPLGMFNTSFYFSDFNIDQLAIPYQKFLGIYFRLPFIDSPYGVGGMKTSVEDLSHFFIAQMNGGVYRDVRILKESSVIQMHTIQYPDSYYHNNRFGLGWTIWNRSLVCMKFEGHSGIAVGGGSTMQMNSSENIGIIFFSNSYLVISNDKILSAFWDISSELIRKAKEY
jgi:CubicO group peptidase (beta-lactamase class C family)